MAARNQTLPEYILVLKSNMVFNLDGDGYTWRTVLIMDRVHNISVWKIVRPFFDTPKYGTLTIATLFY